MDDFAGEFSAADDPDDGLGVVRNTNDLDASVEHDKYTVACVSLVEKNLTRLRAPLGPAHRKTRDLRILQLGEHGVKVFGGFRHRYSQMISSTKHHFQSSPGS